MEVEVEDDEVDDEEMRRVWVGVEVDDDMMEAGTNSRRCSEAVRSYDETEEKKRKMKKEAAVKE